MTNQAVFDRNQRFRWYLSVDKDNRSVKETCRIFGISRKCYYKWRLRDYGKRGNTYSPAKRQPNLKLTYEIRKFIEEQKLKTNYGPLKMKMLIKRHFNLDVSSTIIYRYYQRKKLIRKPQKKLAWYQPLKYALTIVKPGEGVQIDVKYVYDDKIRKYQFSVMDPFTAKYHFTVFPTKESVNAIAALRAAQRYFHFKILSVQTDNGGEFRGCFHGWLTKQNIPHYFIPKSSPYWNAQVDRVNRTIDEEYYIIPYRFWNTPMEWLHYYNFERIHLTHNGLTPHEKYLKSVTLDC